jgi:hypothetical protein
MYNPLIEVTLEKSLEDKCKKIRNIIFTKSLSLHDFLYTLSLNFINDIRT